MLIAMAMDYQTAGKFLTDLTQPTVEMAMQILMVTD
jgi:hypothetical protein